MKSGRRRIAVACTQFNVAQIKMLCEFFNERQSEVIRRAIEFLHHSKFGVVSENEDGSKIEK